MSRRRVAAVLVFASFFGAASPVGAQTPESDDGSLPPVPDWFDNFDPLTAEDDPYVPPSDPGVSAEPITDTPLEVPDSAGVLPEPGAAEVTLGTRGADQQAGDLPIAVAAGARSARGVGVRVEVLDQAISQRAGVSGFAFRLSGPGGAELAPSATAAAEGGAVPATLTIDYSNFENLYGADYADRLRVVALPECAFADPVPTDCDALGKPLSSKNVRSDSRLEVDVANLTEVQAASVVAAPVSEATDQVPAASPESAPAAESTTTTDEPGSVDTDDTAGRAADMNLPAGASGGATLGGPAAPAQTPSGGGIVLALTAGPESEKGSFTATPFAASGDWQVGIGSGEFSWSYPIPMPPAPAGAIPSVSLSYNSAAVDGFVTSKNTQAGQAGLGWSDFNSAFIERRYNACNDELPAETAWQTPDLCWANDNASISLNGLSSELVPVQGQTGEPVSWRLKSDARWKVERLHLEPGLENGDKDGEYWVVTTPDGTKYWFGLGRNMEGGWSTESTWTVPVFGDDGTEPCNTEPGQWCYQAWRWNLDRVVDPNGNVQIFRYGREFNNYMRFNGVGQPRVLTEYVRSGYATEVHYGRREGDPNQDSLAKAEIQSNWRCATLDAPGTQPCGPPPQPIEPAHYPDVPVDLYCISSCQNYAPTFFSARRYTGVLTSVHLGGTWYPQDHVKFTHAYQDVDNNPATLEDAKLWLTGIQRTGLASSSCSGGTCSSIALPPITFGQMQLNNRHDPGAESPMPHWRVGQITDEFGGQINVEYGQPHPCNPPTQGGNPDWDANTTDCFPQKWAPDGSQEPPTFRAFNKYVVTQVEVKDTTGGSPSMVTKYIYGDKIGLAGGAPETWNASRDAAGAAWHHDNPDPWVPADNRSWSDWRGYQDVLVIQGSTRTRYKVFRGMHGDEQGPDPARAVYMTSLDGQVSGTTQPDENWFSGRIFDEMTLRQDGSPETGTLHHYASFMTADAPGTNQQLDARWVGEDDTTQRLRTTASGVQFKRTRTQISYNGFLQFPETVIEHGWTDQTGDERCAVTNYTFDHLAWKIDYPHRVALYSNTTCNGTAVTRSDIAYDGKPAGEFPTHGNPTTTRTQISGSSFTTGVWSTATSAYDKWGRPTVRTDPNNHATTTDYDGTPGYDPDLLGYSGSVTVTNAAGHVIRTNFGYNPGAPNEEFRTTMGRQLPAETIDANNQKTTYVYDELGRITSSRQPTEAGTGPASWTFSYDIDPNRSQVPVINSAQLQDLNGPGGTARYLNSWVVYDSLLRERQVHVVSPASTQQDPRTIVAATEYDANGLVFSSTQPQSIAGAPGQAILPTPAGGWANRTQTIYDHIGRPKTVEDWYDAPTSAESPDDALADDKYRVSAPIYTHDSVDSRWTTPTGTGVGTRTRSTTDAYGRNIKVEEHDGTAWQPTTYTYDQADRLKTVTDPANNKITYTYDMAGRRTAMADPDAGNWTYGYDLVGNQTTVTDALNKTTATVYDTINRPTERHENSSSGPDLARWFYDASGEAGLLDYSRRYTSTGNWEVDVTSYDSRNRPTGRTWTVPTSATGLGGTYTVGYGYDAADHQTSVSYPAVGGLAAETVNTTYNAIGLPIGLAGTDPYASAYAYDDRGRPKWFGYGNPSAPTLSKVWTYDTNQRLSQQVAASPAGTVQDRTISYDVIGNIAERFTNLNGGKSRECFGYDQRDRLTSAYTTGEANTCASGTGKGTGANPYDHQYTYTVDGNIKTRVEGGVTTTYTYPAGGASSVRPHAPTGVGSNTYTWNANGNEATRVLGGQTQTFNWDAEHNLASITSPTGNSSNVYDAGGQRLLRTTPQGRTLYIEGHEITAPTSGSVNAVRSYSMGGQPVATRSTTGGVDFLATDNQGSLELTVGAGSSGTPEVVRTYLPYGKVRTGGQPDTDHSWIGQIEDDHTGLQYLNARYYDPALGVFTAADAVYDMGRPQTLNPFNYSMSNPVSHSDPTGLDSPYDYTGRSATAPAQAASQFRGSWPGEPSTHDSVSLIEREQEKRQQRPPSSIS